MKPITCPDTGECVATYREYLGTWHWREFKIRYFEAHPKKCSHCQIENSLIQLHHVTYARVGNEDFGDVIPLCKRCHRAHHGAADSKRSPVKKKKRRGRRPKSKKKTPQENYENMRGRVRRLHEAQKTGHDNHRQGHIDKLEKQILKHLCTPKNERE